MRELKLPRVAVWIFRQNTNNHPGSANVYDSLGDALLATGDRQGARAQFQRAIDVTVRNKSPVDTSTQRKLKDLERELGRDHSRQK
jgi:predicted negative regulator of RcsB-dependent stress response